MEPNNDLAETPDDDESELDVLMVQADTNAPGTLTTAIGITATVAPFVFLSDPEIASKIQHPSIFRDDDDDQECSDEH